MEDPYEDLTGLRGAVDFLKHPRFLILLIVFILTLGFSVILDLGMAANLIERTDLSAIDARGGIVRPLFLLSPEFWVNFLRDVGVTCGIALLLIIFIEVGNHNRQIRQIVRFRQIAARDVFSAVFSNKMSAEIVAAVESSVFKSKFIRDEHETVYNLYEFDDAKISGRKLIKLEIDTTYRLRNITDEAVDEEIRISFPVFESKELRDLAVLTKLEIDEKNVDLSVSRGQPRSKYQKPYAHGDYHKLYSIDRKIAAGDTITVNSCYTIIKEISDNEIWVSRYPTSMLKFTVQTNIADLQFDVRPMFKGGFELQTESTLKNGVRRIYKPTKPILPKQGFVFWWRPNNENAEIGETP